MLKNTVIYFLLFTIGIAKAQTPLYKVEIDLSASQDDQVPVTIFLPPSDSPFIEYHMAKIVPGTYDISDFGRFVTDFAALSKTGDTLKTEKLSVNKWKIENGGKLEKITYRVHDSWDSFDGYGDNIIFEPGGTNINAEKDAFVINTFGFIGYIKGSKFIPYEVKIKHNEKIYGTSALKKRKVDNLRDVFYAEDFNFLADGPIMYAEPDTATRKIANAEIIVSVYSPNKKLSATEVMDNITDLMTAQSKYLGGNLPVDRYAYLIYLNDSQTLSGSMGALEHSYSSLYSLPEASAEYISQTVRDVAAHEFFHIVTPLNIHSEEIGNFDYIDPKMSQHLWLYEGVTEYSSMHVQVKYDLYDENEFIDQIREKLLIADQFPKEVSFTEMSKNILEPEFADMYGNVYYKGALIAMCLDLYLIKYSDGQKDIQWLMRELAKKYGKEVSFKDNELFDVIEKLTYPQVGEFLRTYVSGTKPLPVEEVLMWAGINFLPERKVPVITLGKIQLNLNEDQEIIIESLEEANEFAEQMKFQEGDILYKINDDVISLTNFQEIVEQFKTSAPGEKVTITVKRENKKGKLKEKKLKGKTMQIETTERFIVEFESKPTDEQLKIRKTWTTAEK